jgi:hypothetical protein
MLRRMVRAYSMTSGGAELPNSVLLTYSNIVYVPRIFVSSVLRFMRICSFVSRKLGRLLTRSL